MNGNETQYQEQLDGSWLAIEGNLEAPGRTKEEAASTLLVLKASQNPPVLGPKTVELNAQATSGQSVNTTVSALKCIRLKKPTPDGMQFCAYRTDDPDIQGLGLNEQQAKLALFKKEAEVARQQAGAVPGK